jgi:predicted DNA-binding transcriptional regulator AlpA
MEDRIAAPQVARLIGIKTPTLAKWRWLGKGPAGWLQVSPTHVTYPRSEVEKFLAERAAQMARRG